MRWNVRTESPKRRKGLIIVAVAVPFPSAWEKILRSEIVFQREPLPEHTIREVVLSKLACEMGDGNWPSRWSLYPILCAARRRAVEMHWSLLIASYQYESFRKYTVTHTSPLVSGSVTCLEVCRARFLPRRLIKSELLLCCCFCRRDRRTWYARILYMHIRVYVDHLLGGKTCEKLADNALRVWNTRRGRGIVDNGISNLLDWQRVGVVNCKNQYQQLCYTNPWMTTCSFACFLPSENNKWAIFIQLEASIPQVSKHDCYLLKPPHTQPFLLLQDIQQQVHSLCTAELLVQLVNPCF